MEIRVSCWNGEGKGAFCDVIREILGCFSFNIQLEVPHKDRRELVDDGDFHIFVWSTIDENRGPKKEPPSEIYGIEVDCSDEAFVPTENAKSMAIFRCPNTGYAVAELFEGNNLFIHHDLCHYGTDRERKILRRLLTDVAEYIIANSQKNIVERTHKEFEALRSVMPDSKKNFVDILCGQSTMAVGEEIQANITDLSRGIEGDKGLLTKSLADKRAAQETIQKYLFDSDGNEGTYAVEYAKLLSIPGVLGIDVVGNAIHVFTKMIRIVEGGSTYRIGKFRIEIPIVAESTELLFFNLTNNGNGPGKTQPAGFDGNSDFNRHHPHINKSGEACLGSIRDAMRDYIRAHQFAVVAILAIKFLETVNVEDGAGRGIKWWPKEIA